MPYAANGSVDLYYEVDGEGGDREVDAVALCGEIGYGPWQWGWQHATVAGPYRVIVPATRGTGDSDAPPGPYTVGRLAADLDTVLADAGVRSAHVVGVGLGGMVALHAALHSGRVRKLALVGTPAYGGGVNPDPLWADPADPEALESSLRAAVTDEFLDYQPDIVSQIVEWRAAEDADREAWKAARAAVREFDIADRLYEVSNEALVIHGREDAVCPRAKGKELAEGLPRGEFVEVDGAGHLANVEASREVNDRILEFFDDDA
ncbi:alpha/beta fold hydrolase [Halobaculum gomorrense]|uniref:Pimeloyl-ACP methyl ester carboxylesterase n=1 Tax=Halobaculum gomorrense TaxID=43928 RepID=A0A1M5QHX0_9EURY|nr:alpha/beta hydrolase [Halobaculum gomorrense]SHH13745.1 Pimeloyl-ACP methyl ester carboxylesterase [Halobaculum gomorrense]